MITASRMFLSATLLTAFAAVSVGTMAAPALAMDPPTTEFEENAGTEWTSHQGELDFLADVAAMSDRVSITTIATTEEGRPVQLVNIGHPTPHSTTDADAGMPVEFHFCSQHGNEPAGREACLRAIRDLAFTDDATLISQLGSQVTLFIPAANPDGREANTRENANGVDLNRQHLQVDQEEVRAIGRIARDWSPAIAMDHHEYAGTPPLLYDDNLTVMWPRNKNVHVPLRDMAKEFVVGHTKTCTAADGFSMDEYGTLSLSVLPTETDVTQTAGGWDDGISRNIGGLRHSLGILIESDTLLTMQERVDAQLSTIECTLEWMQTNGTAARDMMLESKAAKLLEGELRDEATFFDGQDEDTNADALIVGSRTESTSVQDPPFCGFTLTDEQLSDAEVALEVHGIASEPIAAGGAFVSMAQQAEPVIGLLLDQRGFRHLVAATGLDDCSAFVVATADTGTNTATDVTDDTAVLGVNLASTGGGAIIGVLALLGAGAALRRREG
ncbi:MAG: hypothetical protein ACI970_001092 [Myxococcota bacterium]|jgi:hypothetical protein